MRLARGLALLCAILLLIPCASVAEAPRGTFYEIYVRAYADGDGDGIGDLKGLRGKLDYLSDMGVGGLWLMPVFDAKSDHGYDTVDYYSIDPDYGTNEDMRELIAAARERGIVVILDFVMNHTSTDCAWFQNALDGGDKRDWYRFYREGADSPSLLTAQPWGSPVWHDSRGGKYYGIFWDGMPDLNLGNPEVKDELLKIARYWLDMGVAGFRLDATSHFFAYGEEELKQRTDLSGAFLAELDAALRADYPDLYIVGEAWETLDKRKDILAGIDSVFDFDFGETLIRLLNQGGDANAALKTICANEFACEAANPDFLNAVFLTNHDQNRVLAQLKYDKERYRLAAGVLLTFSGNPFLYYGEEIGMLGAKPDEEIRTPMLWGGGDPAECTFIKSRYNKKTVPYAEQKDDPESLYSYVRTLARLRRDTPALLRGELKPLDSASIKVMAYERSYDGQTLLVLNNFSSEPQTANIAFYDADVKDMKPIFGSLENGSIPPMSTVILQK